MEYGKKLFAIEFAKRVLCLDKEDNSSCNSCIKFENNNHPDFKLIEPDGNSIKIGQIRELQDEISQKPITSDKKVYVINDCDTMTVESQNCLLKTLEEPPEYAVIILVTSNESKLLTTVKSRCTKILFTEISNQEIEKYLNQKYENLDKDLLKLSEGSIGRAINLQENKGSYLEINNLIDKFETNDLIWILNNSEILYKQKENINEILNYMNTYLFNKGKINCIKYIEDTKRRLASNSNYDMTMDYLLMRIWEEFN